MSLERRGYRHTKKIDIILQELRHKRRRTACTMPHSSISQLQRLKSVDQRSWTLQNSSIPWVSRLQNCERLGQELFLSDYVLIDPWIGFIAFLVVLFVFWRYRDCRKKETNPNYVLHFFAHCLYIINPFDSCFSVVCYYTTIQGWRIKRKLYLLAKKGKPVSVFRVSGGLLFPLPPPKK